VITTVTLELAHPRLAARVLRQIGECIREAKMGGVSVEDDQIADWIADQIEEQYGPTWVSGDVVTVADHTLLRGRKRWSCTCGMPHEDDRITADVQYNRGSHVLRDGKPAIA
jgi:hypothetical protein